MDSAKSQQNADLTIFTAKIVTAYVQSNSISSVELPRLILDVHSAFTALNAPPAPAEPEAPKPAVSVRRSVTPDRLVCLECGKTFKSIKRHLATSHDMTPDQYRQRWSLPGDYPMVAPNYSEARSTMAKSLGFGRKAPPKRRGRKPATAR